jgi:hypothetical protein
MDPVDVLGSQWSHRGPAAPGNHFHLVAAAVVSWLTGEDRLYRHDSLADAPLRPHPRPGTTVFVEATFFFIQRLHKAPPPNMAQHDR